jgi:hypothetical protein
MGDPAVAHQGTSSNVQAFVLSPVIRTISIANVHGSGSEPREADITLTVSPPIYRGQKVILLLNELSAPDAIPMAYSFQAAAITPPSPSDSTENITITVTNVRTGTYLVRLQVDGAESPLQADDRITI